MKRIIAIIFIIIMVFSAGCKQEAPAYSVDNALVDAERLLLEGNYEEVILTLETVIEVEPANVRGYLMLADAYVARGDEEKALLLLQTGLDQTGDEQIAARIQGMTEEITDIVDVSSGGILGTTTLLLTRDGELYYCGEAGMGDETVRSLVPQRIDGATNIKKLIASENGCYYLTHDNELFGWGWCEAPFESGYNQIGSDYRRPRKIMDNVLDIATASSPGCGLVLKTDHTLYSWGNNEDGQLGRGLPYDETQYEYGDWSRNYEMGEILLTDVVDIDMISGFTGGGSSGSGLTAACAVTADGGLYIWGRLGSIEEDGVQEKKCYNSPQRVFEGMIKARLYGNGILGIDKNGLLVQLEWRTGNLEDRQVSLYFMGDGQAKKRRASSENMDEMATASQAVKVTDIDCGFWHFLALGTDGTVYTGGRQNSVGQLGISEDSYLGESTLYTPLQQEKIVKIAAAVGGDSSFAITEDGKLLAWGNNSVGQLGNGRSGEQRDDEQKHLILSGVKEVIAGDSTNAYAIKDNGDLYTWGYHFYADFEAKEPVKVFENVKTVAMGDMESLVLTNDGCVYTAYPLEKYDKHDFMGITNGQYIKHEKYQNFYKLFEGVKDIHSLSDSYFILYENGELWGWGDNYNCLLGIGTKTDASLTVDQYVYEPVLIMEDVADITGRTYILKKNGDLYYSGYDFPEYVLSPILVLNGVERMFESDWSDVYYLSNGDIYYYNHSDSANNGRLDIPQRITNMGLGWGRGGLFIDEHHDLYEIISYAESNNLETSLRDAAEMFGGINGLYYRKIAENAKSCAERRGNIDGTYFYVTLDGDLYSWGSNDHGLLGIGDARQDENIFEIKLPK